MRKLLLIYSIIIWCTRVLVAQSHTYTLHIVASEADNKILRKYNYPKNYTDSISVFNNLQALVEKLQYDGYLACNAGKTIFSNDTLITNLIIGQRYTLKKLGTGNIPQLYLNTIKYSSKQYENVPFRYKEIGGLMDKILKVAERNGFPFAQISLDSLEFENTKVNTSLKYLSGQAVGFDSLAFHGNLKLKQAFLNKYLRIKKGDLYSQQKVDDIDKLLKRFPFVTIKEPSYSVFKVPKAYVQIYANQKKVNQIDGIIGILPNELEPQKILFTGQFDLKLRNLFQRAISFEAEFQKLKPTSEFLNIQYKHPVLLGANIDGQVDFNLLREDTSFININRQITFYYNFGSQKKLSAFVNYKTSQLGFSPENTSAELPNIAETNYTGYGLGYEWHNLNDFYYPTHGFRINGSALVGNKEIVKNPVLDVNLYDNIALNTLQIELRLSFEYYHLITKRNILYTRIKAGNLINENLFTNDLFRLGGLNSLRGFNQNFFFASSYGLATLEYRFLLDTQSYILLFYDQAYLEQKKINFFEANTPTGVGAGISFSTPTGIFNFIYAVGGDKNQPLDFNRSKIHFGFVSRF